MHTDHFEEIAAQLKKLWGGQTLATLRDDARRELNGTCFTSLRPAGELRRVLVCGITGEHEVRKLGHLDPAGARSFGDWSAISLFEAVVSAFMEGGFAYDFDSSSSRGSHAPVVLIAAVPDSVTKLENLLGLKP
jgi:hypothetical protein